MLFLLTPISSSLSSLNDSFLANTSFPSDSCSRWNQDMYQEKNSSLPKTVGSITSRCSGKEPALLSGRVDQTRERGGNRAYENSCKNLSTGFFFLWFAWLLSVRPYFCHISSLWYLSKQITWYSITVTDTLTHKSYNLFPRLAQHRISIVGNISSNLLESWIFFQATL